MDRRAQRISFRDRILGAIRGWAVGYIPNYNTFRGANLIDYSYLVKADGTVEMTVSVTGTVKFAVLQASIALPTDVSDVTVEGLSGTVANLEGNTAKLSYFTVQNTVKKTDVLKITFKPTASAETLTFGATVEIMTDAVPQTVSYTVIGDTLRLK